MTWTKRKDLRATPSFGFTHKPLNPFLLPRFLFIGDNLFPALRLQRWTNASFLSSIAPHSRFRKRKFESRSGANSRIANGARFLCIFRNPRAWMCRRGRCQSWDGKSKSSKAPSGRRASPFATCTEVDLLQSVLVLSRSPSLISLVSSRSNYIPVTSYLVRSLE